MDEKVTDPAEQPEVEILVVFFTPDGDRPELTEEQLGSVKTVVFVPDSGRRDIPHKDKIGVLDITTRREARPSVPSSRDLKPWNVGRG